jgi:hypothetical protein
LAVKADQPSPGAIDDASDFDGVGPSPPDTELPASWMPGQSEYRLLRAIEAIYEVASSIPT